MSGGAERRLEELFRLAIDVPTEEREAFVQRHCGDDPALQQRLRALLAEDAHGTRTVLQGSAVGGPSSGQRVGRYTLVKLLGSGGMGSVYLAHQNEPVQRDVALKTIHPGLDTAEIVRRFENERQTLALMSHPGIAEIYDGGVTETGQPYFVMEYVEGLPITEYCDRARLDVPARLRLLCRVCAAVQHAHQKAIIHRDLKPANVLVTEKDGEALPKIIDFGIARGLARGGSDPLLSTSAGGVIGTLAYMSPEQADPHGTELDTRSDVYALGAMLYELLAGAPPFDADALRAQGWTEAQRLLREQDPPPPSARLAALGARGDDVARARRSSAPALVRLLRGELDWIAGKALAKDRNRRYATAAELRADLEHYLADEPVSAGPPTSRYRARKFVRRHRLAVGAAALLLLSLAGGTAAAVLAWRNAAAAHDAEARRIAELRREHEKKAAIAAFLTDALVRSHPVMADGAELTVQQMLDDAAPRIEDAFAGRPPAEAAVRSVLGNAYLQLGELGRAREQLRLSYVLRAGAPAAERFAAVLALIRVVALAEGEKATEPYASEAFELAVEALGERHPTARPALAELRALRSRAQPTEADAERALDALARALREAPIAADELAMATRIAVHTARALERGGVPVTRGSLERVERAARAILDTGSADFATLLAVYAAHWLQRESWEDALAVGDELAGAGAGLPPQHWLRYEGDCVRGRALLGLGRWADAEASLLDVFARIEALPRTTERLRTAQQTLGAACDALPPAARAAFLEDSWKRWRAGADTEAETWWPADPRFAAGEPSLASAVAVLERAAAATPPDPIAAAQLQRARARAAATRAR